MADKIRYCAADRGQRARRRAGGTRPARAFFELSAAGRFAHLLGALYRRGNQTVIDENRGAASTRADRRVLRRASDQQEVALWGVSSLVPSEMVLDAQVKELARRIAESGIWTHPIPVCAKSGLVMDGNHRLKAAKSLGL